MWILVIACILAIAEGKTKCQELQLASKPGLIGAFVPQCKDNGEFEEKQCWGSTGYCWCVDKDGKEIEGTKIRGDPDCSKADPCRGVDCHYNAVCRVIENRGVCECNKACPRIYWPVCGDDGKTYDNDCLLKVSSCEQRKLIKVASQGKCGQTKCQQLHIAARPRVGAFVPQCKENGEYEEKQCWASTGYCWCVDKDGNEIDGTKIRGDPDCSKAAAAEDAHAGSLTLCQYLQAIIVNVPGWCGPPACKEDGSFAEVQCCASTGECYCVDSKGKEILGTRKKGERPTCERNLSACENERQEAQSIDGPRVGAFIPECLEDGSYNPVQCWPSTGYCWCVDKGGKKVPGSDVRFKRPKC